jgi:hypothetical protein
MSRLECLICFGQSEAINSFLLVSFRPQINPHCGASLTFLRRQLKPVQFVAVVVARAVKKAAELWFVLLLFLRQISQMFLIR